MYCEYFREIWWCQNGTAILNNFATSSLCINTRTLLPCADMPSPSRIGAQSEYINRYFTAWSICVSVGNMMVADQSCATPSTTMFSQVWSKCDIRKYTYRFKTIALTSRKVIVSPLLLVLCYWRVNLLHRDNAFCVAKVSLMNEKGVLKKYYIWSVRTTSRIIKYHIFRGCDYGSKIILLNRISRIPFHSIFITPYFIQLNICKIMASR